MQRLALLGMHIANDPALCSRLARALRFVADWHRSSAAASDPDAPTAVEQSVAAAETAKVSNCLGPCHEEDAISMPRRHLIYEDIIIWAALQSVSIWHILGICMSINSVSAVNTLLEVC